MQDNLCGSRPDHERKSKVVGKGKEVCSRIPKRTAMRPVAGRRQPICAGEGGGVALNMGGKMDEKRQGKQRQ